MRQLVFLFCTSLYCIASPAIEETGYQAPVPYYKFDDPQDFLPLIKNFLPSNPTIVEAGAFDGRDSCLLAQHWPEGEIHSFEPVTQLYQLVVNRTKSIPSIHAYQLALGDVNGYQTLYLSQEPEWEPGRISMSSSLLMPKEHLKYSSTQFSGTETVEVITLDKWAEERKIEKVDMLWLDLQGYALLVLKAASKLLSGVSVILTELEFVEAYEGQARYKEIRKWLEDQGFVLIGGTFSFPRERKKWFGDGLFVRKELLNR